MAAVQGGFHGQGAGDGGALALAAGEVGGAGIGETGQTDRVQQLGDSPCRGRAVAQAAGMQVQQFGQSGSDGLAWVEAGVGVLVHDLDGRRPGQASSTASWSTNGPGLDVSVQAQILNLLTDLRDPTSCSSTKPSPPGTWTVG